jgi:predicted RNA-binding protein YlxR (DUF448 family)
MGRIEPAHGEDRDATGTAPERTCAVTRAKLTPAELIRFVRAPDGTITPDLAHRLPGRGVWVTAERAVVAEAAARNAFARSLKRQVAIPHDLAGLVEELLVERCIQALAIANKAGLVVAGFAKVETAIAAGRMAALVHASEASADGKAKLDGRLRARLSASGVGNNAASVEPSPPSLLSRPDVAPEIVTDLTIRELSLALGRENVVHAALIKGGAAQYFLTEVQRLRRYRSSTHAAAGRPPRTRSNTEQV